MENNLKQGGVLSGLAYSALTDEIAKELINLEMGYQIADNNKIPCLLWVDDIVSMNNDITKLQETLNVTSEISKKYKIDFGFKKCNILSINDKVNKSLSLQDKAIENCNEYKYLGLWYNNKGNLDSQIKHLKGKVEAAYQTVMYTIQDHNMLGLDIDSIWTLVDSCIIPIILYGTETLFMTKKDKERYNSIFTQILKRICKVPNSTPNRSILIETGYQSIEKMIEKRRIMYYHRLKNGPLNATSDFIINTDNHWKSETKGLLGNLSINDIEYKKEQLKNIISLEQKRTWKKSTEVLAKESSKLKF